MIRLRAIANALSALTAGFLVFAPRELWSETCVRLFLLAYAIYATTAAWRDLKASELPDAKGGTG